VNEYHSQLSFGSRLYLTIIINCRSFR